MTDQEKLYDATADGLPALRELVAREGWEPDHLRDVAYDVKVKLIHELNLITRATTDRQVDAAPFLWRLDALRQMVG